MRDKAEEKITLLGEKKVKYHYDYCPEILETFENRHPDNDYWVKFNCPEFTALCPITGQPDFATMYLVSVRSHGDFHEDVVNVIMKDLIKLMEPKYIEVWGKFLPRGGISIDPFANYGRPGTKFEALAWERFKQHDLYALDKVDNR